MMIESAQGKTPREVALEIIHKLDTRWSQIEALRTLGRDTAEAWLGEHRRAFGRRSTLTELPEAVATA